MGHEIWFGWLERTLSPFCKYAIFVKIATFQRTPLPSHLNFVYSLAILAINRHFCYFRQCVHFWTFLITQLRTKFSTDEFLPVQPVYTNHKSYYSFLFKNVHVSAGPGQFRVKERRTRTRVFPFQGSI